MDQSLQGPTGGASVDWRGLCEELADALACHYSGHVDDDELVNRVRAELAKPERFLAPQVTEPTVLRPTDRYELGELVRVSWLKHGNDAWCSIADDVIAALAEPEPEDDVALLRAALKATAEQRRAEDDARAALAAKPVGEGSSDEHLNRVYQGAYQPAWERGEFHGAHYDGLRAVAAAVAADLLEQRHPAPVPPVEGEVGELVEWLRDRAESTSLAHAARRITRAADLLQLLASPACLALKPSPELTEAFKDLPPGRIELLPEGAQVIEPAEHTILVPARTPVPVAIPGEEYHEDMGAVTWWRLPVDEPPWVGTPNDSDWPGYHTHFTPAPPEPATALPLPQGEVE